MIANITKGADFAGLARYLFQARDQSGEVRPEVVYLGGSVPGRDPASIGLSMDAISAARPSVTVPVRHWMLSFAPEDLGKYDHDAMRAIAAEFSQGMGATAYACVSHGDHLHIMASAVTHDGGYVRDTWDFATAQTIVRRIERAHGLRVLRSTHEVETDEATGKLRVVTVAPPDERRLKQGELNAAVAGTESHRLTLQALVSEASKGAPTLTDFVERLEVMGVEPRIMVNKTGWTGVSFGYQGTAFKGQDLGNKFKARELQKGGVTYEKVRDGEAVERCRGRREDGGDGVHGRPAPGTAQPDAGATDRLGNGAGGDARANGESRGAPGGEPRSADRPEPRVPRESDRDDGGHGTPSGARGRDSGDVADVYGRDGEDAGPRVRGTPREDGGSHIRGSGSAGDGAQAAPQPSPLVARLVARDGAYSRVLGLAAAELLAGSEGGDGVAEGLRGGRRASLQRVAVGAFSAVAADRIRHQVAAMGVARVEVGILPPKDRDDLRVLSLRTWSADQVVEPRNVAFLAAMNSKGYDIYIRPSREEGDNKGLVLLDDLDAAKVAQLTADGLEPSVVVQTSPGNLQAWVRVSRDPLKPGEGTLIAKALAERYGADPGAADWCHFGRLAPFANRKAVHRDPVTGHGPLTELRRAVAVVATRGVEFVAHVRSWLAARAEEERVAQERQALALVDARARWARLDRADRQLASPSEAFQASRAAVQTARPDDESARDYGAALRMLGAGYDPQQVVDAMLQGSPCLAERKGRGAEGYVARTVEHAEAEVARRGWRA